MNKEITKIISKVILAERTVNIKLLGDSITHGKGATEMEKLYNNIILNDNFYEKPSDAETVPYLINPPDVIDVSVGRQLFVDNFLIEETDLVPEYHKAQKFEGNPVLYPEKSWECENSPLACPKSGGVWYDEDEKIFKMWYEGGWMDNMCYATSLDGINWTKPDLGIIKGTNIILPYEHKDYKEIIPFPDDVSYLRPDSTTVFIDYNAPKEEKYKLFLRNPGWEYPGIIGVSGDGIHFSKLAYTGIGGDRSTIFYNPFRKKWVHSVRSQYWNGEFERSRIYYECDNFSDAANWDKNREHYWMKVDDKDLPHPAIGQKPHLYNVDCVGYESIMLGMFQILYGPDNNACAQAGVPKVTELMPMYSRDGFNFSRPSRESIINATMQKGSWDRGYVQSVGGVTIINGDELWIYYIAFAGDESKKNETETIDNGMYCNGATGIAKLRRDGFVSMNGDGTLTSRKLTFKNKKSMFVNIKGKVKVWVLDDRGVEIAASNTFDGDSTKAEVIFDNFDISTLGGRVFRLKFEVCGELYSFGFADENGEFGGARAAGVVK